MKVNAENDTKATTVTNVEFEPEPIVDDNERGRKCHCRKL